jgi:hypothetical protein
MFNNEKIEFALALNLSRFRKSAQLAVGNVQNMSRDIKASVASAAVGMGELRNVVVGVGVAATAVAVGGLLLLKKGLTEAISLSNIQEEAETRLAAVIRATGGAAGYTVGELKTMAGELQLLTGVGDEVILSGQAILGTFKEIKGDQFREATMAALDMAAVLKKDVNGIMTQLGKALNDPAKGLSALSKSGVSFTESQKEMIVKLQESGDMMGAQRVILDELKSEYGGAAAALRGTFGGAVNAAGGAFSDMQEAIGRTITQNSFLVETFNLVEQKIMSVTQYIDANQESLRELTKKGILSVVDGIGMAVEVVRFFYNGWQGLKLAAHGAVVLIIKGTEMMVGALRQVLFPLDLLLEGLAKIGWIDSNPLADLEATLKGFGDYSADEFMKLYESVEKTNQQFDSVKDKIAEFKKELAAIPAARVDVAEQIQAKTNEALQKPVTATVNPKSYTGGSKAAPFELVDGVWQAPKDSPVQNTINNFQAPVDLEKSRSGGGGSGQPDKVLRLDLPNGASLQGDADQTDQVIEGLRKAGLTAQ